MKEQLVRKLSTMDIETMYKAVYVDALTGALNRKAFNFFMENHPANVIAIIDLDSLKFLNDFHSHRVGDNFLCLLAKTLQKMFGEDAVFRIGGDEFAVLGASKQLICKFLSRARNEYFPGFSWGVAATLAAADKSLIAEKQQREEQGLRAARGECPPWLKKDKVQKAGCSIKDKKAAA